MTTVEILTAARALIADKSHWAREFYALDPCACAVDATDPAASRWCLVGALQAVCQDFSPPSEVLQLLADSATAGNTHCLIHFNDSHTHSAVIQAFDTAIELAKEQTNAPQHD